MRKIVMLIIASILFLAGCKAQDEKNIEEKKTKKEPATFSFVDVKGNEFQAPLLETVAKNNYNYSKLEKNDGLYRYKDDNGTVISKVGIDVSKYQTAIDWNAVKASGIDFVIVRLGYRGYGEAGTLNIDEMFESHIQGATAAGLEVGVYFYSQAINDEEALEEAEFVLAHIEKYNITYPVVFDTEVVKEPDARTLKVDKEQFTSNCIIFCNRILEAGYDTMIYANMTWLAFTLDMTKLEKYDKWYADYNGTPQSPYEYTMWQYTEEGIVNGIEGAVDLNILLDRTSIEK
ncbi:MAG: glycoside hydrolase family 25 protein [Lachnospiraceae bacterium]|nr:glycoside hydrolase family 25 protein [Lachnospiraceae bacterium]